MEPTFSVKLGPEPGFSEGVKIFSYTGREPTNACLQLCGTDWLDCYGHYQKAGRCCTRGESYGTCNMHKHE